MNTKDKNQESDTNENDSTKTKVEVPEDEAKPLEQIPYKEVNNSLRRMKFAKDILIWEKLSNFTAKIVCENVRMNGAETQISFIIEGRLESGENLESIEVLAEDFSEMKWPSQWGWRPTIFAGNGNKDHVRTAVQLLSGKYLRRLIHTSTGWQKIEDKYYYLHSGGAIGCNGFTSDVEVDLGESLKGYNSPITSMGEESVEAVKASLCFLDIGPDTLTVPLFNAIYRAPLGNVRFSIHLAGPTGVGKSVTQGLVQAHYGASFSYDNLPGSWQSTAVGLEFQAYALKDSILCIDDFAPDGTKQDQERVRARMAAFFRSVGNGTGKGRGTKNLKVQKTFPPRCLPISSGEDLPAGESNLARVVNLEVAKGMFKWDNITEMQVQGKNGQLARAMAAYLQWLAPKVPDIPRRLEERARQLREKFSGIHKRNIDQAVQLLIGGEFFLDFAKEIGALSETEAQQLWNRFKVALETITEAQAKNISASDPVNRFISILTALLVSRRIYFEGTLRYKPKNFALLGWPDDSAFDKPQGTMVGWADENKRLLYLEPGVCYDAVVKFASNERVPFPLEKTTLWERLFEREFILRGEKDRYSKKAPGRGQGRRCIALRAELLGIEAGNEEDENAGEFKGSEGQESGSLFDLLGSPIV